MNRFVYRWTLGDTARRLERLWLATLAVLAIVCLAAQLAGVTP